MTFWDSIRIALRALARNKLRSGLTVLGVVIGIAAVTTMVSIGQSASAHVESQLVSFGANMLVVLPGSPARGGFRQNNVMTLTAKDAETLQRECPDIRATSPVIATYGSVVQGNNSWRPKLMLGVGEQYGLVRNWQVESGRFFLTRDIITTARVCVLGHTVHKQLFQFSDPLGQTVRIRNVPFQVIGVLEAKGANIVGDDQDDLILVPFSTARKRLEGSSFENVDAILVSASSSEAAKAASRQIEIVLRDRHHIRPQEIPDFQVQNTEEVGSVLRIITTTLGLMLSAIAGISLLVGGVGIMNIMLVSVTERTREIGIRMAVGALSRDIMRQFLIEAIVLSTCGGILGVILGTVASISMTVVINYYLQGADWPIVVSFQAAGIALVFAGAVGLFFGYYPARRASLLDPIEALRYE